MIVQKSKDAKEKDWWLSYRYQNIQEIGLRYRVNLRKYQTLVLDGLNLEPADAHTFFNKNQNPVQQEELIDSIRALHPVAIKIEDLCKLSRIIQGLDLLNRQTWMKIIHELCDKLQSSLDTMSKTQLTHIHATISRNDFMNNDLLDLYQKIENINKNGKQKIEEPIERF